MIKYIFTWILPAHPSPIKETFNRFIDLIKITPDNLKTIKLNKIK